jgi:hypothetical protein
MYAYVYAYVYVYVYVYNKSRVLEDSSGYIRGVRRTVEEKGVGEQQYR